MKNFELTAEEIQELRIALKAAKRTSATVVVSESNINEDSTIALLKSLEQTYPFAAAIYVILDNAKYPFSGVVLEYVKDSKIKLVPLPSYAPELNLIERLWRVFKKNVLYNQYYKTFAEFKESCLRFFKNQSNYHNEIQSIMGEGLEALAA